MGWDLVEDLLQCRVDPRAGLFPKHLDCFLASEFMREDRTTDQLFKSLLHQLMTGEVSIEDLDLSALPKLEGSAA